MKKRKDKLQELIDELEIQELKLRDSKMNDLIAYSASLYVPEGLPIQYSAVMDRVDELTEVHQERKVYADDVLWSYIDGLLIGTYYSQWDFPYVQNILEVIYNEFINV